MPPPSTYHPISPIYSLILLTIEPLTALAGFIAAHFFPAFYLAQTALPASPLPVTATTELPTATHITLRQLANLYLLFALNEALVLRAASYTHASTSETGRSARYVDIKVWRTLLAGLLVADLGHLWSLRLLGTGAYWRAWEWNGMGWGNFGVVYAGIITRVCFLMGVGIGGDEDGGDGKDR